MAQVRAVRKKGVSLELNGEMRLLSFDLNSFAELEDMYGTVADAMERLEEGSVKAIRNILWAGLIHDQMIMDPQDQKPTGQYLLTPFEVGSWIDISELPILAEKLQMAMAIALPEAAGAKEQPAPNVVSPTP